jgi:uncharacterized alkaline shock family protein YloU
MDGDTNPLGNIYISHKAIATIAYQSAISSYGVVGLAPKNFVEGIANAIVKDPTLGVEIIFNKDTIDIDLFIIIEYGTRVKSVASTVANQVRYQVEKTVGIHVHDVNVHVRGLHVSNPD